MLVQFIILTDNIFQTCRDISNVSNEGTFTIKQIADSLTLPLLPVQERFLWLLENDWIACLSDDGKENYNPDEFWCLRKHNLTIGRIYEVLGIEADDYRILTDENSRYSANDPVLFSPTCFKIIDSSEPPFWVSEFGAGGERYAYPSEWKNCFFEKYHDDDEKSIEQFWNCVKKNYPFTWKERKTKS